MHGVWCEHWSQSHNSCKEHSVGKKRFWIRGVKNVHTNTHRLYEKKMLVTPSANYSQLFTIVVVQFCHLNSSSRLKTMHQKPCPSTIAFTIIWKSLYDFCHLFSDLMPTWLPLLLVLLPSKFLPTNTFFKINSSTILSAETWDSGLIPLSSSSPLSNKALPLIQAFYSSCLHSWDHLPRSLSVFPSSASFW